MQRVEGSNGAGPECSGERHLSGCHRQPDAAPKDGICRPLVGERHTWQQISLFHIHLRIWTRYSPAADPLWEKLHQEVGVLFAFDPP